MSNENHVFLNNMAFYLSEKFVVSEIDIEGVKAIFHVYPKPR